MQPASGRGVGMDRPENEAFGMGDPGVPVCVSPTGEDLVLVAEVPCGLECGETEGCPRDSWGLAIGDDGRGLGDCGSPRVVRGTG